MKNCPVCNAVCFDDMEMCFDCLHRFDQPACVGLPSGMAAIDPMQPIVSAEYSKMPSDCSEGIGGKHCITLHIQVPEGAGSFTVRCQNLQIEGALPA